MKNIAESFRPSLGKLSASLCSLVTAALLSTLVSVFAAGGDLDPVFGANPGPGYPLHDEEDLAVFASIIQPDGKVIISGGFTSYNGVPRHGLARLNPDGSLDLSFDSSLGASVIYPPSPTLHSHAPTALALQIDGRILVGGLFNTFNGTPRNSIARLNADGSLDPTFDPGTGVEYDGRLARVASISVQPDKKIIITGQFLTYNGTTRGGIARLNPNGTLDGSFDPGTGFLHLNGQVYSPITTCLLPDGRIMVGGYFNDYDGTPVSGLVRAQSQRLPRPHV